VPSPIETCGKAAVRIGRRHDAAGPRATEDGGVAVALETVRVEKPGGMNVILGQAHFVKTVDDLHEALAGSSPHLRFGIAFCEASGPLLVRVSGNDDGLVELATRAARAIGAGHCFAVFLEDGYPVNVLNQIKLVPEVCRVYCATANPLEVIVAQTEQGRGVMGVVDGEAPVGIETEGDVVARKRLVRELGYKL
jgi:adenosine/AMP kinase